MALDVTIKRVSLKDLLPDSLVDIAQALNPITAALVDANRALGTIASALETVSIAASSVNSTVVTAATLALSGLQAIVSDVRNAGIYMLMVPPTKGGLNGFSSFVRRNLYNVSDPNRPVFSSEAYVYSFGMFGFAISNDVTQSIFSAINGAFASTDSIKRAAGIDKLEKLGETYPHMYQNQLALTARPLVPSPWVKINVVKFIPGFEDILYQTEALLKGLMATVKEAPIAKFIRFLNRSIATIANVMKQIQDVIDYINNCFTELPIVFFGMDDAQVGGTMAIAGSLSSWFSNTRPEIADVTNNCYTTGLFAVGGGPSAPAEYIAIQSLIFP
jgi:hypothetical protein